MSKRMLLIVLGLGLFFSSIGLAYLCINDFGMSVSLGDFLGDLKSDFQNRVVSGDLSMTWSYDDYAYEYIYSYKWGEVFYNFFSMYYFIIQSILVSLSIHVLRFAYHEEN